MSPPLIFFHMSEEWEKIWSFKLVCPGNAGSVSHERVLLLKNATVNMNFDDLCLEKQVYVAYNRVRWIFEVNNITGEMVKYVVEPIISHINVAHEWEMQAAFFEYNNIKPKWYNAYFNWGTLNKTSGQWSGAVGMIQRDEVDYAIWGFAGTYARSKVAAFSPGIEYLPYHWLTRYPQKLSPTWNLLGLFTKGHNSQISRLSLCLYKLIYSNKQDKVFLAPIIVLETFSDCHATTEKVIFLFAIFEQEPHRTI